MGNTNELSSFVDTNSISSEDAALINKNIDSLIERYKGNRQEVNRLVFESVAAMTAGDEAEHKLSNKRGLRRFIGSITGSNKKLQDQINQNRALAQYAGQQTLQKLAEQNMMSFDLIAAVNNKLNASMVAVEAEFSQVYDYLGKFFKKTRSDIVQLESRVKHLERKVDLLDWQNSIEYLPFNGVEYSELDDPSKMVCLARDFYEITEGNWTTSDLLLLKTAMATIDISPKTPVNYFDLIKQISSSPVLKARLLGNKKIIRTPDAGYLTIMGGIKKLEVLQDQEAYIVDTVSEQVDSNIPRENIEANLAQSYLTQETQMDVNCNVPAYELILEMIYNIRQAEDEGLLGEQILDESLIDADTEYDADENNQPNGIPTIEDQSQLYEQKELDEKFQKASDLFRTYHPLEALPLLQELSDAGYGEANALLYWLYCDGYYDPQSKKIIQNESLGLTFLAKGMMAGDSVCGVLYCIYITDDKKIMNEFLPSVEDYAKSGDIYAEYTLCLKKANDDSSAKDYQLLNGYLKVKNFYRATYSAFRCYFIENSSLAKDQKKWTALGQQIIDYGCPSHVFYIAYTYMTFRRNGSMGNYIEPDLQKEAFKLWEDLTQKGLGSAATNLGWMYEKGYGTDRSKEKALIYYGMASKRSDNIGKSNYTILESPPSYTFNPYSNPYSSSYRMRIQYLNSDAAKGTSNQPNMWQDIHKIKV